MRKVRLILGVYSTVPSNISSEEFEKYYENICKPLITLLYNSPEMTFSMYYSGILINLLEKNHPEFISVLSEVIKRKQIEIIGGGFYEPFFPLIPSSDRVGHVELMTTAIRKIFGKRPRGFWIPSNIWDQNLASVLKSCGIDFSFLPKKYFTEAGVKENQLCKPFLTEDQGKFISIFPLSDLLDGTFYTRDTDLVIDEILSSSNDDEENPVISFFLDSNALYSGDYAKNEEAFSWLKKFSKAISQNKSLSLILPGQYIRKIKQGDEKLYFQSSSFRDLHRWLQGILLHKNQKNFNIHSRSSFKQILSITKESNLLYCKMAYVSILTNQLRGDRARKNSAREEIWKSQENTNYWYAPQGGIYNNRQRKYAYSCLIEAERITRQRGIFIPSISNFDFDMDGQNEYLYQGHEINAYIHLNGGALFEFDYIKKGWNYLDTITRGKEFNLYSSNALSVEDAYLRNAFVDHFFVKESLEDFQSMNNLLANDFLTTKYHVENFEREHRHLTMTAEGSVRSGRKQAEFQIWKKYFFRKTGLEVHYRIKNVSGRPVEITFGSEINLSVTEEENCSIQFWSDGKPVPADNQLLSTNDLTGVTGLDINDTHNDVNLALRFSDAAELWSLPVNTETVTKEGSLSNYQSSCFLPRWELVLENDQVWTGNIVLSITPQK